MKDMKFPYIIRGNKGPHVFHEGDKVYPFSVPSTEIYAEFPWPKSLCSNAHECPVSDTLTDLDNIYTCTFASQNGCPLFLDHFDEFAELETVKDVEIFEIGQEVTKDWTDKDLDQIVANAKLASVHPPMVALGHDEGQDLLKKAGLPAAGWVSKVRKAGKKLICDLSEVPKLVAEALRKKAYRYISAEIYPSFLQEGKDLGKVLRRIALLGADIPRVKSLQEVMARYDEEAVDKNLKTFWTGACDMNEDEKKKQEEVVPALTVTNADAMAETALQAQAEKMAETDGKLLKFTEQMKAKDLEIAELKAASEALAAERKAEKCAFHLRDIDQFCEQLKSGKGLSAAVLDEGGVKDFLTCLDTNSPIKFSETEEKTAYQKGLEVFSLIADKAAEGVLTVPLGSLKEPENFTEIPKGHDPEGTILSQKIRKYADEHSCSYEIAYAACDQGGNV